MVDILDTRFEEQEADAVENFVAVGDDVNLRDVDPGLKKIMIGAGWDSIAFNTDAVDLDVSLFLLNRDELTRVDEDFIFYNQMEAFEGGITHHGDNRTGAGDGDDECITIDLESIPFDILRVMIVVSVYKGFEREQNISMVRNAYIRLVDSEKQQEILRYKMDEDWEGSNDTGVIAGVLNREGPKWHFVPQCEGIEGGLPEIAKRYGIIVKEA